MVYLKTIKQTNKSKIGQKEKKLKLLLCSLCSK